MSYKEGTAHYQCHCKFTEESVLRKGKILRCTLNDSTD